MEKFDQSAEGKPAKSMCITCTLCKGESFKLLANAPSGAKIGDRLPKGAYNFTHIECQRCGELFEFKREKQK